HVAEKPDKTVHYGDRMITIITDAFSRGVISEHDAKSNLVGVGLTEHEADLELSLAEHEYNLTLKKALVNTLKKLYLQNTIDANELVTRMGQYGFSHGEISKLQNEIIQLRNLGDSKPTKAELVRMLKKGIITGDDFITELQGLGYHDKYIAWYL